MKKVKQIEESSDAVSTCENVEKAQGSGKKTKSKKSVESAGMDVAESGALNPGSKVDEVSKSKKEKKRKHKIPDEDHVSEGDTEKDEESSKRKKKRKAADENEMTEDSSTKQDSCDGEVKKKKRKKTKDADAVEIETAGVAKAPKDKKRKKMAVGPEHAEEVVSKPEKTSTAAEEVIANRSGKKKKADKMRLLKNSAKDCGFKGSNLGEIKSYGCAA